jgi:transposase
MRYLDSRAIPVDADIRTVTVMKESDGWDLSVLLNLAEALPEVTDIDVQSAVGIDVGINKLVSLSDGSFVENRQFATNKKTRRQLRIGQRRGNRRVKGSHNRRKAGIEVAKLHKKIADKRNDYQWKAAYKIVRTADVIVREDLNIPAMKKRVKPKRSKGRFMPCGHIDHADTQVSRTLVKSAGFEFVRTRRKNLPGDSRKVAPVSHDAAQPGKRHQGRNRTSKAVDKSQPEKRILVEQLCLQLCG